MGLTAEESKGEPIVRTKDEVMPAADEVVDGAGAVDAANGPEGLAGALQNLNLDGQNVNQNESTTGNTVDATMGAVDQNGDAINGEGGGDNTDNNTEEERSPTRAVDAAEDEEALLLRRIRALLRDTGTFHTLCEEGYHSQGSRLETPENLRQALNHICADLGLEEVTMEEATELFQPRLDNFEFYQLSKQFFDAVARSLDPSCLNLLLGDVGQGNFTGIDMNVLDQLEELNEGERGAHVEDEGIPNGVGDGVPTSTSLPVPRMVPSAKSANRRNRNPNLQGIRNNYNVGSWGGLEF